MNSPVLSPPVQASDLWLQLCEPGLFQTQLPTRDTAAYPAERESLLFMEVYEQAINLEVAGPTLP